LDLGGHNLGLDNNRDLLTYLNRPVGLSAITRTIQTVKDNLEHHGYENIPLYFTYQVTGSGIERVKILSELGATNPRNVNHGEIRAMINVAYLSGANGAFGWQDYHTKKTTENGKMVEDKNAGLFKDQDPDPMGDDPPGVPALDEDDTPRLTGVMLANQDIMDVENYLEWSVGPNRTIHILRETLQDDFWIIQFKFDEKSNSEFWAVMNRRLSDQPTKYTPSSVRSFRLNVGAGKYLRECRFPAGPRLQTSTGGTFELSPGEFRMFEASVVPLTVPKYRSITSIKTPAFLFRNEINPVQIDFTPDEISPPYVIRVFLQNGINRALLNKNLPTIGVGGAQNIQFDATPPLQFPDGTDWPLSGNDIILAVEKPGVLHQELYRFPVDLLRGGLDSDRDGLSDRDEVYEYHTRLDNPHSDTDGLTDGEEVKIYGTDRMPSSAVCLAG